MRGALPVRTYCERLLLRRKMQLRHFVRVQLQLRLSKFCELS